MNLDDAVDHVGEVIDHEVPESMTYELAVNDYGVAFALVLHTGLGDGVYPVEARFEEAAGTVRIAEIRIRFDRLRAAPMMRACLTRGCPN